MAVYFITCRSLRLVKIGHAKSPWRRFDGIQTSSPAPVALEAHHEGSAAEEKCLHERFAHLRERGEWFKLCPEIEALIEANRCIRPGRRARKSHPGTTDWLIQRFCPSGYAKTFAKILGVPNSTVAQWRKQNRIPHWRHPQIIKLAEERGVELTAADFPPSTTARRASSPCPSGWLGVDTLAPSLHIEAV